MLLTAKLEKKSVIFIVYFEQIFGFPLQTVRSVLFLRAMQMLRALYGILFLFFCMSHFPSRVFLFVSLGFLAI